jgi:hypothetical protein
MGPVPLSLFPLVWAWDDAAILWCNIDSTVDDIYLVEDHQSYQPIEQEMQRMTDILDAKYKKKQILMRSPQTPIISPVVNKSHYSNF